MQCGKCTEPHSQQGLTLLRTAHHGVRSARAPRPHRVQFFCNTSCRTPTPHVAHLRHPSNQKGLPLITSNCAPAGPAFLTPHIHAPHAAREHYIPHPSKRLYPNQHTLAPPSSARTPQLLPHARPLPEQQSVHGGRLAAVDRRQLRCQEPLRRRRRIAPALLRGAYSSLVRLPQAGGRAVPCRDGLGRLLAQAWACREGTGCVNFSPTSLKQGSMASAEAPSKRPVCDSEAESWQLHVATHPMHSPDSPPRRCWPVPLRTHLARCTASARTGCPRAWPPPTPSCARPTRCTTAADRRPPRAPPPRLPQPH